MTKTLPQSDVKVLREALEFASRDYCGHFYGNTLLRDALSILDAQEAAQGESAGDARELAENLLPHCIGQGITHEGIAIIEAFASRIRAQTLEAAANLIETHAATQTKDGMKMQPARMSGCESRKCQASAIRSLSTGTP